MKRLLTAHSATGRSAYWRDAQLTAGALNSMCVQPGLVLEKRSKQQRGLPMLISFGARRKRAGIAQNTAPMLNEFSFAVERAFRRQFTSNRRHGSHLFRTHRVMPVVETSLLLRSLESVVNIAHFKKLKELGATPSDATKPG